MIKLIDILREIKVNKPGKIELIPDEHYEEVVINNDFKIEFYFSSHNKLFAYATNTKKFIKDRKIPYNQPLLSRGNKDYEIPNWEKYFKVVKNINEIKINDPTHFDPEDVYNYINQTFKEESDSNKSRAIKGLLNKHGWRFPKYIPDWLRSLPKDQFFKFCTELLKIK